jgi:hypothetical protein
MNSNRSLLVVLFLCSCTAAACVPVPTLESQRSWTASPITAEPARTREIVKMPSPTPTRPKPTATPTPDPHRVVITEQDVERSVAAGAAAQGGAQVQGLAVRFADGKMRLSADQLTYGMLSVSDLVLIGRLVAQNGQLQMQVESVQPGGLIGAVIPGVVNQALKQYTAQWYVEDVDTLDGRLELRIR